MTTATISPLIETIGASAFNGCTKLKDVYFLGKIPTIGGSNFTASGDTVHYMAEYINPATNLTNFFSNIEEEVPVITFSKLQLYIPSDVVNGIFISWAAENTITSCSISRYNVTNGITTFEDTTILSPSNSTIILSNELIEGRTYKFKVNINGINSIFSNEILYTSQILYRVVGSSASVYGYDDAPKNVEDFTNPYNTFSKAVTKEVGIRLVIVSSVSINGTSYNVTQIEDAVFSGLPELLSVSLPPTLVSIGVGVFTDSGLTSITLPDSLTAIGASAFSGTNLTNITIPRSVTTIGETVFLGCDTLSAINVSPLNLSFSSSNGVLFDKQQTTLIVYPSATPSSTYTIPNTVQTIAGSAFAGTSLTTINFPSSLTTIEDGAFTGANNLTNVVLPPSVTNVGESVFPPNLVVVNLYKKLNFYLSDLNTTATSGKVLYEYVSQSMTGDVVVEATASAWLLNTAFCFKTNTPEEVDITRCSFKVVSVTSDFSGILPKTKDTHIVYGQNSGFLSPTQNPPTIPYEYLSMISNQKNGTQNGITGIIGIPGFVGTMNKIIDTAFNAKLKSYENEIQFVYSSKNFIQEILLNIMTNDPGRFTNVPNLQLPNGFYRNLLRSGDTLYYRCDVIPNPEEGIPIVARKYLFKLTLE